MAKKQESVKKTAAAAPPTRAAKPKTPRVKAAQHSKVVSAEPVIAPIENAHEVIAQIAYGFWESRWLPGRRGDRRLGARRTRIPAAHGRYPALSSQRYTRLQPRFFLAATEVAFTES